MTSGVHLSVDVGRAFITAIWAVAQMGLSVTFRKTIDWGMLFFGSGQDGAHHQALRLKRCCLILVDGYASKSVMGRVGNNPRPWRLLQRAGARLENFNGIVQRGFGELIIGWTIACLLTASQPQIKKRFSCLPMRTRAWTTMSFFSWVFH